MTAPDEIGVGIIGLGFMGGTHVAAYARASAAGCANRLVAVCDSDPERRAGRGAVAGNLATDSDLALFDPTSVRGYAQPAELLADPDVALVSICTPTDSHVELALAALDAGKHVLVEKPVGVRAADVSRLAAAARRASTVCMPAHCIRFWPAWARAREAVRSGELGRVRSAVFRRLATRPTWSAAFYADAERTGGALGDLHLHDTDFVVATFGPPAAVSTVGYPDHVTTTYRYADGPEHVVAEGGWDHTPGFDFRMSFTIVGERATLDYALGREPECLRFEAGAAHAVSVASTTGYDEEIRHLLRALAAGTRPELGIRDALLTARVLEAERTSLASGLPAAVGDLDAEGS